MTAKLSRLLCAILSLLLLSSILTPIALASNDNVVVYVTNTGTVYHRWNCSYLKSHIAVTLEWAVSHNYTRCRRCDAPILGTPRSTDNDYYGTPLFPPPSIEPKSSGGNSQTHKNTNEQERKKSNVFNYIIGGLSILLFTPIGWLALSLVTSPANRRKKVISSRTITPKRIPNYKQNRAAFIEKYSNKSLDDFALIPTGVTFDQYGKPRGPGRGKWGRDYTFYRSKSGKTYHSKSTCTKGATIPIHAMDVRPYSPCKRCKPMLPDLSWYYERERIKSECRYYGITIPEHPLQIQAPTQTAPAENEQLRLF